MADQTDPKWASDDPQRWEAYWSSWYQIVGAKPVQVENYARTEADAIKKAQAALDEALKKVIELGLKVDASCWTVKRRHRRQTQTFEPSNLKEFVTADWYGRLAQVSKSVHESEARRG
jgi:hypothetical protein